VIEVVPFSSRHQAGVIHVILPIQQAEFNLPITLQLLKGNNFPLVILKVQLMDKYS
jgi:hypothetical protein